MAALRKPICPQCRTEDGIILLDKNTERAMYKCKKCKPFHVFSIMNASDCGPQAEDIPDEPQEMAGRKPCRAARVAIAAGIVVVIALAVYLLCRR